MVAPAVSLKNVHLTLTSRAGRVDILRGIDLTVNAGEALGIVGPSGSGKTTLLMVIAGLERVSSGAITVERHAAQRQERGRARSLSAATISASSSSPFI